MGSGMQERVISADDLLSMPDDDFMAVWDGMADSVRHRMAPDEFEHCDRRYAGLRDGRPKVVPIKRQNPLDVEQAPPLFVDIVDFIKSIRPPEWLVDGVIQRSYLYGLTAPMNHGKTALAAHLAVMVAIGGTFADSTCAPGRVIYLAGENPDDFKLRLAAACQSNGVQLDEIAGRVTIMPFASGLNGYIADIRKELEGNPAALVIIDTSVAYFSYKDENSNVDIRLHAQDMRSLIDTDGRPAVVCLCHPVKNAGQDNIIPRGGSAFINELDCNLTLWKDGDDVCALHHNKLRGPSFNPIQFRLVPCVLNGVLDTKGREVTTVVTRHLNEAEAGAALDTVYSDAMLVLAELAASMRPSVGGIARALGWLAPNGAPHKGKVHRVLKELLAEKLVLNRFGKWSPTEAGRAFVKKA